MWPSHHLINEKTLLVENDDTNDKPSETVENLEWLEALDYDDADDGHYIQPRPTTSTFSLYLERR